MAESLLTRGSLHAPLVWRADVGPVTGLKRSGLISRIPGGRTTERLCRRRLEKHPRVHDPLGIESGAEGAQGGDFHRALVAQGLGGLHGSKAMFGADRAAHGMDQVMDDAGAGVAAGGE